MQEKHLNAAIGTPQGQLPKPDLDPKAEKVRSWSRYWNVTLMQPMRYASSEMHSKVHSSTEHSCIQTQQTPMISKALVVSSQQTFPIHPNLDIREFSEAPFVRDFRSNCKLKLCRTVGVPGVLQNCTPKWCKQGLCGRRLPNTASWSHENEAFMRDLQWQKLHYI